MSGEEAREPLWEGGKLTGMSGGRGGNRVRPSLED